MKHLRVIPWIRRKPGEEATANVLQLHRYVDAKAPLMNQGGFVSTSSQQFSPSSGPSIGSEPINRARELFNNRPEGRQPGNMPPPSGTLMAQGQHHKPQDTFRGANKKAGFSGEPAPLSLIYAQVNPKCWLVAECDEWDRESQQIFQKLFKACLGLLDSSNVPESSLQWFNWPLKVAMPLENTDRNLKQAIRGWVHGRGEADTQWISLGRRFFDILVDDAIPSGQVYKGQSAMSIIWFDSLTAMQVEPALKARLWQYLRSHLSAH